MHRRHFLYAVLFLPAACVSAPKPQIAPRAIEQAAPTTLDHHIAQYASFYDVPESLVHRVVKRESTYNPKARNGPYYGLMQILPATARTMGFQGAPNDLLDAETNLKYGVKYLRGAWLLSNGSHDQAVKWYSRGYYYEAKKRGMLVETGLRPG
ncbi:lytic transglycosylase domain-containing protein [Ahrensia sp. 13_GOM-1096m]|uniref:lytic transglycosylase domain-containing protein n=1 Tax=Ahrensia sp. 13_GOM-1096m TaxID=1380380 RepID=UPI000479D60B|nr:lytic transglycosylase domain-containing protein [Ahrensia sp. 13_GOM-1096m]